MLLWPDYWNSTVAPDLYVIAPEARHVAGTVETGQLVVNKELCWTALQLVLFLNLQGSLYYSLLTNYMGMGDKETFPTAMLMLQQPYAVVVRARAARWARVACSGARERRGGARARQGTPVGSAGIPGVREFRATSCPGGVPQRRLLARDVTRTQRPPPQPRKCPNRKKPTILSTCMARTPPTPSSRHRLAPTAPSRRAAAGRRAGAAPPGDGPPAAVPQQPEQVPAQRAAQLHPLRAEARAPLPRPRWYLGYTHGAVP